MQINGREVIYSCGSSSGIATVLLRNQYNIYHVEQYRGNLRLFTYCTAYLDQAKKMYFYYSMNS